MIYIQKFIKHVLSNLSLYVFVFFIVFTSDRYSRWITVRDDAQGIFYDDVGEYYNYLPAFFIPNYTYSPDSTNSVYYVKDSKRTVGMAIMYSPFFFIADAVASKYGYPRTGYSEPYQVIIHFGTILYCLLGLWICRKSLLLFFNDVIAFISLLCIFLGTNLFYYTYGNGEMSHSYLFFLNSLFIYCSILWIKKNRSFHLTILSLTLGLITLIRPTDIIVVLFPLLFGITSFPGFTSRFKSFFSRPVILLFAIACFLIPLTIQMMVWKKYTGHYIHYSYGKERFFFNDPQIMNILFSFRKGWLVYTPIMAFSVTGIILSKKYLKDFFFFMLAFFVLNIYILSCWWDWSYGGSFGCRAVVQSYAFLIFPFAVFIQWCWNLWKEKIALSVMTKTVLCIVLFLLIKLNLFQSWQYKFQIINYGGMNRDAYEYVFLKERLSPEEYKVYEKKLTLPDYKKMLEGERD
ncbi:MAG: hypothetical protein ACXVPN_02060 [Bacteroidia bacterium]